MSANNFQYKFDDFTLVVEEKLLFHKSKIIPISCRTFDILFLLVENEGRVMLKQELMEKVWENSFVEEGNLTVAINALRKALKTDDSKTYIETFPKRGYRFNGKVEKFLVADNIKTDLLSQSEEKPNVVLTSNLPLPKKVAEGLQSIATHDNSFQLFRFRLVERKWLILAFIVIVLIIGASFAKLAESSPMRGKEQICMEKLK